MAELEADQLKQAVERMHGGMATFAGPVRETFEGKTVWEGVVHVLDLAAHPCLVLVEASTKRRFFAVPHQPPIDSPQAAVRAAIVPEKNVDQDKDKARHRVCWSGADSLFTAPHRDFRTRDEANEFAQDCLQQVKYVWIAELGIYRPLGSKDEAEAWFFRWWSPAAVAGTSGPLPRDGYGMRAGSQVWRAIRYRPSN